MNIAHHYLPESSLLTDFYQFTMAAALFEHGRADCPAVFHLFFRKAPFKGSFAVAAGITDALDLAANFRFEEQSLSYLSKQKSANGSKLFSKAFIDYLEKLAPLIDIYGVKDSDLIFPHEPVLRIEGPLGLCMLLETPLLNIINFQTLIATKAARMKLAAGNKKVVDFGLRRAQGFDGAISASKAAAIGGIDATSNVWAAKHFNLPLAGTQAHSFIMSYATQQQAFRDYAQAFPDDCVLLVDTYDTRHGIKEAIDTMSRLGSRLRGIRLDSGDLLTLSQEARVMLDQAGLRDCQIIASGELDEYEIERLRLLKAPIDVFGVGTKLVTAFDAPSLGGVYKLAAIYEGGRWRDTQKISNSEAKETWPGHQAIMRFSRQGHLVFDQVFDPNAGFSLGSEQQELQNEGKLLTRELMKQGLKTSVDSPSLGERTIKNLAALAPALRQLNPGLSYPVIFDKALYAKKAQLKSTIT